jgi:hypothetical protein
MKPKSFWDAVEEHTGRDRRSCLTCFHLRTREHATMACCDLRPRIFTFTNKGQVFVDQSMRRARECQSFEGEDCVSW